MFSLLETFETDRPSFRCDSSRYQTSSLAIVMEVIPQKSLDILRDDWAITLKGSY